MTVCCFWLEFANLAEWGLRRYTDGEDVPPCPREGGRWGNTHGALVILGTHPAVRQVGDNGVERARADERTEPIPWPPDGDPRWPTHCECGFAFRDSDPYQRWTEMLYRRSDNGELTTLRDAPPGAMWDSWWYPWKGPDGKSISVKCPNGDQWNIDGQARNCTREVDDGHHCWVRHGEPPKLTVDKNGKTCAAGAGSIQTGDYHGFLRDGCFT